ncbi:hypothetical protein EMIHUDRAFT_360512 [Emiliania huxleyi CCMP1516]|uniref:Vesicle transport protein n=2 Tax=Emiliania huxleyi TaxID=2903 RepID=A0A0D3HXY5_EMIH1|nr:hypothetical protein EMIHUDRAFT_360512 [Emiliania huxleyi CCMP1516]EOD03870.1 hypothetical protein EMIHUDRAFT_360512 [Emiliania huxleyi CCMP1516]|eukprot:XP_005756299.1 hypothetical protein EMIHUDRAFT_360512 [Emiliania huxleyi CCMP1516]
MPSSSSRLRDRLNEALGRSSQPPPAEFGGSAATVLDQFRVTVNQAVAAQTGGGSVRPGASAVAGRLGAAAGVPGADSMCPSLTFKQRLYGTVGCFCVGFVFSLMGTLLWWTGHVAGFALLYTLGNVVSMAGTGFLIGPRRQLRNMCKSSRQYATALYFTMMLLTIFAAISGWSAISILVFCILQWCAMVWYVASYIPYGQRMLKKILGNMVDF